MATRARRARPLTGALLNELAAIRTRKDSRNRKRRRALLDQIAAALLDDPRRLRDLHEQLLFAAAYPDSRAMLVGVEGQLKRVAGDCEALYRAKPSTAARHLDDTGIAGSRVHASFSIKVLRWLANRFGSHVHINWDDEDTCAAVEEWLALACSTVERDGLLVLDLSTQDWVRLAQGLSTAPGRGSREPNTELAWLVHLIDRVNAESRVLDLLLEAKEIGIRWHALGSLGSRTLQRFPIRPLFIDHAIIRDVDVRALVSQPLDHVRRLPPRDACRVIDLARAALAVRTRETDPVTNANAAEVTMIRLQRGIDIALFGIQPDCRQPLESYFGYVAARNRVPVAYGGGWVFLKQCEIGINIFDTFRGGESAFLFAQILRVYRQHFNVNAFVVDPYQIGHDNPEAIASGAFWFYMRLGFRPCEPALAALAHREWSMIQANRRYRTSRAMLRRLATSTMSLDVGPTDGEPASREPTRAPDVRYVGLAVTEFISQRFRGDRSLAERVCAKHMKRKLGVHGSDSRPVDQRRAFEQWSVLAALVPDVNQWPTVDRRRLARLMFAKGGLRERPHAVALGAHARLRSALAVIDARGRAVASGEMGTTKKTAGPTRGRPC